MKDDRISKKIIEDQICGTWAGKNIFYYEETDSTNLRAKCYWQEEHDLSVSKMKENRTSKRAHGTLVVADTQSAGRGRRGRSWDSPTEKNIYMTLLLEPEILPQKASMLTLVMAISVWESLEEVMAKSKGNDDSKEESGIGIKWPNDLVLNKRKICGILTEMSLDEGKIQYVIIGVGINVNQEEFSPELEKTATSLKREMKKTVCRAEIIGTVMKKFEKYYKIFLETEDLSEIQERYNRVLINNGRRVRVLDPGNEYAGVAAGINKHGELIVQAEDGECRCVYAGEVSVRGLYGYV